MNHDQAPQTPAISTAHDLNALRRPAAWVLALLLLYLAVGRGHTAGIDPIAPAPYDGALVIEQSSLEDQARRADLVLVGRITGLTARNVPGGIDTDVRLDLEHTAKGQAAGSFLFTIPGGSIGAHQLFVGGVPNFVAGERVLVFLRNPRPGETAPHLVQLYQSKYTLQGANAVQPGTSFVTPIPQVEQRLGTVLGKGVIIGTTANTTTPAPFTSSCEAWAPSSMPIPFQVNGANPGTGGPGGAAFANFVYHTWHDWVALGDSALAIRFTGLTDQTVNPDFTGSDHTDGINTIAWGSTTSLGTGVIGVNFCYSQNGARIDSDELISNDRTWDADPSNGIDSSLLSLYSVVLHELGHGIGVGHPCEPAGSDTGCTGSDGTVCDTTANTPVMCPVIGHGVNKTMKSDDQAGAQSLYPLTGALPSTPTGLIASAGSGSSGLTWSPGGGARFAYDIERAGGSCAAAFSAVGTVNASTFSFVDNDVGVGLSSGTFCYRVKALGQGGDSGYSNAASTLVDWNQIAGAATDVGVSPEGTIFVIGTGGGIYRYNGSVFVQFPGAASRIAVGPSSTPWVINSAHLIYRWTGSTWQQLPGAATDIGVGANGDAWVIGTNGGIYKWNTGTNNWDNIPGAGTKISVGPTGDVWVINAFNQIYHRTGAFFQQVPGAALDVGEGPDGIMWVVGTDTVGAGHGVYQYNGSLFLAAPQVPNGAVAIAGMPAAKVAVISGGNLIYVKS